MPESRGRKAADEKKKGVRKTEASERHADRQARTPSLGAAGAWVAPTFITLMLLGVVWLVV